MYTGNYMYFVRKYMYIDLRVEARLLFVAFPTNNVWLVVARSFKCLRICLLLTAADLCLKFSQLGVHPRLGGSNSAHLTGAKVPNFLADQFTEIEQQ